MPDFATYLAFLAALLVMQLTPGPDMALVVGRGIGQGQRIALCTVLGFMGAGVIQVPLLLFGITSLLHASPFAFDLMRWFGAAYLVWLGVKLLWPSQHQSDLGQPTARPGSSALNAARDGLINNLTSERRA